MRRLFRDQLRHRYGNLACDETGVRNLRLTRVASATGLLLLLLLEGIHFVVRLRCCVKEFLRFWS